MKHFKIVLFILVLDLTACTSLNQRIAAIETRPDTQYLKSEESPMLQVPAGLNSTGIKSEYPIPRITQQAPSAPPSLAPPGSDNFVN